MSDQADTRIDQQLDIRTLIGLLGKNGDKATVTVINIGTITVDGKQTMPAPLMLANTVPNDSARAWCYQARKRLRVI